MLRLYLKQNENRTNKNCTDFPVFARTLYTATTTRPPPPSQKRTVFIQEPLI